MTKFIINKREIEFLEGHTKDLGNYYTLPTLKKKTKKDKEIRWDIFVCYKPDDSVAIITDSYYYPNGKHKVSDPTVVYGKNIDKKNKTSNLEQGLFQAHSMWLKKKDQNYNDNEYDDNNIIRPMLANKYTDRGMKYLTEPFAVSYKLDGIRAIGYVSMSDTVLHSRNGKQLKFLNTIKHHLKVLLSHDDIFGHIIVDGELYSHDLTFNEISSIVRSSKKINELDSKMKYWIFDIIDTELTYRERIRVMKRMESIYSSTWDIKDRVLVFVDYELNNHSDVYNTHEKYVSIGFEGLIARELDSKYEIGVRSNYLLKYKEFEDKEYTIIDFTSGVGGEEGAIIFICITSSGYNFNVRPRGSVCRRREMYSVGHTFLKKNLTVRFQESDPVTHIPRFPVGIEIRDYD